MKRTSALLVFLIACVVAPVYGQVQDITPPTVSSFTFSASSVDVRTTSQTISVFMNVADNLSGVDYAYVYLRSPSGQQARAAYAYVQSGASRTGSEFRGNVTFYTSDENGTWTVDHVWVRDLVGNQRSYYASNNTLPAGPTIFGVQSNVTAANDTVAPTLISFSFTPTSINTSNSYQYVEVVAVADDGAGGSGVRNVYVQFTLGNQFYRWGSMSRQADGSFKGNVYFPRYVQQGEWKVQVVYAVDNANNWRYYWNPSICSNCSEPMPASFPRDLTVVSDPSDSMAPVLQSFEFTPTAIDVATSSAQVVVTARITDNVSGVGSAYLFFYSPGNIQNRFVSLSRTSGNAIDGIYRGTISFPQYSAAGIWSVYYFYTQDAVGNYRVSYTKDLQDAGFPAFLQVSSGLSVENSSGDWGGSATLSARLTSGGEPSVGKTIEFFVRGTSAGSSVTNAEGIATLAVSLTGIDGGTYVNGIRARFPGDSTLATIENTANLTVRKVDQTLDFANIADRYIAQGSFTASATTSSGLPVTFSIVSGPATVSGPTVSPSGTAGSVTIRALQAGNGQYAPVSAEQTFELLSQRIPTINWTDPAPISYGTPLGAAQLNATANADGSVVEGTFTYDPPAGALLETAEAHTLTASFTPANLVEYTSASKTVQLRVSKASATIALSDLSHTYDGTAKPAIVTTVPAGLSGVSVTYDGSPTAPTGAGTYAVVATLSNGNYETDTVNGTLAIAKATATITISDLSHVYSGQPIAATVTVLPEGLSGLSVSYDGTTTAPTNAGSYVVAASLTNSNYEASAAEGALAIAKAPPAVSVTGGAFTYDTVAHAASGTASGVDTTNLGPLSFTYNGSPDVPVNAGTYEVIGSIGETANHLAGSANATITINKADPVVEVTGGTFVYNAGAHAASGTVAGPGGALSPLTFTYNGDAAGPVNAGTYAVVGSYAGDANHNPATGSATITINKAQATISLANLVWTYDGGAKSATASTDPSGLSGLSITYNGSAAPPVNAGSYSVVAVLTNDNYEAVPASGTLVINKGQATLSLGATVFTYSGSATAVSVTTSPAGLEGVVVLYGGSPAAPVGAGGYPLSVSLENPNYEASPLTGTLTINRANPIVSVNGGTFTYDTLAHPAWGNATGVDGSNLGALSFTYNGSSGVPLNAGTYSVVGSIPETANHTAGSASTTITIDRAGPTLTWTSPSGIVYGTALGATQLNANASFLSAPLNGTFSYTPAAGTILNAGTGQTLSVLFTPADTTNFNTATTSVTIDVAKAEQTISWTDPASIVYGTPLGNAQRNATVSVVGPATAGSLTYSPAVGTVLNAGSHTLTVDAAGTQNYHPATKNVTIAVTPAPLSVTAENKARSFGLPNPPLTASFSGFVNGDDAGDIAGLQLSTAATETTTIGTYPIVACCGTSSDYTITFISGTLTIGPAPTSLSLAAITPVQYSDKATFMASLSPATLAGQTATGSVQFFINGSPAGSPQPIAGGTASLEHIISLSPGDYTVTAQFTPANANFSGSSSGAEALAVNRENAVATYTGALFAGTECPTCSNAKVLLSATVQDITAVDPAGDPYAGDIRNANVGFVIRTDAGTLVATIDGTAVQLINGADPKTGTSVATWTANIGSTDSEAYKVTVVVGGHYVASSFEEIINISKPLNDMITGGGYLNVSRPAGSKPADVGSKNNFGFNVKYNKGGKNLQGKVNAIFRRLEADGVIHVYQIKSTAIDSLSTQPATGKATFTGKANLTDVTNPDVPVSIEGGVALKVTMTDRGEPGSTDAIAITLWNKSGVLLFSSDWTGVETAEKTLGGGNLVVR